MPQIGPRIDPTAAEALSGLGPTLNAAATLALEAWPVLYRRAIHEIHGTFSRGELSLILDACNGLHLLPRILGEHIALEVHDSIKLNRYDEKHDVNGAELLDKLTALTSFQRAALELWTTTLWRACEDDDRWEREIEELSSD